MIIRRNYAVYPGQHRFMRPTTPAREYDLGSIGIGGSRHITDDNGDVLFITEGMLELYFDVVDDNG